jgi:GNAT superfamily N-acetyltransferase
VLPDEVLIALLATDTTNHLGFVVVAGDGEEIIAHAQLVRTGPAEAEVALAVSDTWQGRGIGRRLLAFLQERGDALGLDALEAEYLSENRRIIAIFRDAHFTLHHTPGNGLIGSARMALRASEGFRAEPLSALAAPAAASSDDNLPWQRA